VDHGSDVPLIVIAFACFTAVSTATVALIFFYYARSPEQARAGLAVLQERVTAAGPAVFAVVALAVGIFLIADGWIGLRGS
jgi:hypothetical protein